MDTELILITVASLAFWVLVFVAGLSFFALRRISRLLEAAIERGYGLPQSSDIGRDRRYLASDETIEALRGAVARIEKRQEEVERALSRLPAEGS